jgi:mRNA interferase RelE/StbE
LAHEVRIAPAAERAIGKLPAKIQGPVLEVLDDLAEHPRPAGSRKVRGLPRQFEVYRVVVAKDYRVIYQIRGEVAQILVLKVGDRKEVYRRVEDLKRLLT